MSFAEMGKVPGGGRPASGRVDGVVDVAALGGAPASGEAAVFVSGRQVPSQSGVGSVAVHSDGEPGAGVGEDAVPAGGSAGEIADEGGIDRTVASENTGFVGGSGQGPEGDADLDAPGDGGGDLRVAVGCGGGGQQQVGEHVCAQLIHRPGICCRFGRALFVAGHRDAGVADVVGGLGEAVVNGVRERCGKVGNEAGESVVKILDANSVGLGCEAPQPSWGLWVNACGDRTCRGPESVRAFAAGDLERELFVPGSRVIIGDSGAGVHDDPGVAGIYLAVFEGRVGSAESAEKGGCLAHAALDGAVADAHCGSEFGGDFADAEV